MARIGGDGGDGERDPAGTSGLMDFIPVGRAAGGQKSRERFVVGRIT